VSDINRRDFKVLSVQYAKRVDTIMKPLTPGSPDPPRRALSLLDLLAITAGKTHLVAFVSSTMSPSELHMVGKGI